MADVITQVNLEAGAYLRAAAADSVDLLFLDSERVEYPAWWPDLKRVLRPGGLLVVDNALSHAAEMAPFIALVGGDPEFTVCTVPVGKGEFLATRHPGS
jgi:predicted O-methyltransferase YrrM